MKRASTIVVSASNQYSACPIIRGLHWTNGLFLWVNVTLGPGVRLDVRFLRVALVLGLLLLPPAMQICGKRVFGMTEGIDGVW